MESDAHDVAAADCGMQPRADAPSHSLAHKLGFQQPSEPTWQVPNVRESALGRTESAGSTPVESVAENSCHGPNFIATTVKGTKIRNKGQLAGGGRQR